MNLKEYGLEGFGEEVFLRLVNSPWEATPSSFIYFHGKSMGWVSLNKSKKQWKISHFIAGAPQPIIKTNFVDTESYLEVYSRLEKEIRKLIHYLDERYGV